jgi:amidase
MQLIGPDGGDALCQFLRDTGSHRTHPLLEGWLQKLEPYRTSLSGFAACWSRLDQFRAGMFRFMQNFDAILSPVSAISALRHGTSIEDSNFRGFSYTMTHNLTGWPAAVVRYGGTTLPIGVQIAAHPWREDIALAIATHLETAWGSSPTCLPDV